MTPSTPAMRYGASPRTIRRWLLAGLAALLLLLPATAYPALEHRAVHEGGPRLDSRYGPAAIMTERPGPASPRSRRPSPFR